MRLGLFDRQSLLDSGDKVMLGFDLFDTRALNIQVGFHNRHQLFEARIVTNGFPARVMDYRVIITPTGIDSLLKAIETEFFIARVEQALAVKQSESQPLSN